MVSEATQIGFLDKEFELYSAGNGEAQKRAFMQGNEMNKLPGKFFTTTLPPLLANSHRVCSLRVLLPPGSVPSPPFGLS